MLAAERCQHGLEGWITSRREMFCLAMGGDFKGNVFEAIWG